MRTTKSGIKIFENFKELSNLYILKDKALLKDGEAYVCCDPDESQAWSVEMAAGRIACYCTREDDAIKIAEMFQEEALYKKRKAALHTQLLKDLKDQEDVRIEMFEDAYPEAERELAFGEGRLSELYKSFCEDLEDDAAGARSFEKECDSQEPSDG